MHYCQLRPFSRVAPAALFAVTVLVFAGCEEPEIKKYTAAKEKSTVDKSSRLAGYKAPDDWVRMSKVMSPAVAGFEIGEGKKKVTVTLTRFIDEGGLVANIDRWRKQIGLPPGNEEQNRKDIRYLNIDGEKTPYVDLANPGKADSDRILGVIAKPGSTTWFFKMYGPPDQVELHKAAFEQFVESVRFAGSGANQ
ncbi:MAG TPA: hypothetical protein VE988_10750 [Gemmataceae bacterium]|nr:hypothetical protein [Gemmataceae bacterium]